MPTITAYGVPVTDGNQHVAKMLQQMSDEIVELNYSVLRAGQEFADKKELLDRASKEFTDVTGLTVHLSTTVCHQGHFFGGFNEQLRRQAFPEQV